MGTMLIVKVVLLSGIALEYNNLIVSSWPISENPVTFATSPSKRDVTTPPSSVNWSTELNNYQGSPHTVGYSPKESFQAVTTARTKIAQNPSQGVTHAPYRRYETNGPTHKGPSNRPGQFPQATSALPVLQGGFQVSQDPRLQSSSNGFPKSSAPYTPTTGSRIRNSGDAAGNRNSQHSEPKKSSPQIKQNSFSFSGGPQYFMSANTVPAIRSNRQSPTGFGSFDAQSKFHFSPSTMFNVQTPSLPNSAQRFPNSYYKGNSNHDFKNSETSPISFSSGLTGAPSFKSFDKLGDYRQYNGEPNFGHIGKQVSNPFQFHNSPQFSGFIKAVENEPVLISTGLNYQTEPSSGLNADFPKPNPSSLTNGPNFFTSTVGNYKPHVLPVHSSSSTAQIPRYKGASVSTLGDNGYAKSDGGYQLLANQPQLHFTGTRPVQPVPVRQPTVFQSKRPFEEIRTDVEVINKKRPQPVETDPTYEHDFHGDFNMGRDFTSDDVDASLPVKNSEREISFEVPRSNLFDSYDEAFGKYSKLASLEQNRAKTNPKPIYPNAEDDDAKDDKSGEYRSSYSDEKGPGSGYDDEDEEESRRSERHESRDERGRNNDDNDDDRDDEDGSEAYRSYGVDFEKDFEESYLKELPKNDYVHVKEVPEIEDPASGSKKRSKNRNSPRSTRGGTKQNSRRVVQDDLEDPKGYESYTSHNYEKPRTAYKDSEGHGSGISYVKTQSSQPIGEQSYGYKIPQDRGTTRYAKSDDYETTSRNEDEPQIRTKKSANNRDANRWLGSSRRSSNELRSTSATLSPTELISAFASPSFGDGPTNSRAFVNSEEQGYRLPQANRQSLRYFPNGWAV